MTDSILMAPSILSADFSCLGEAIARVEEGGADYIHVDVMDGHFVPNLTIGPPVIKALKKVCTKPLDVHLMIDDADTTIQWYLDAGADCVSVHIEACDHIHRVVQAIRDAGAQAAVTLNPGTPISSVAEVLGMVDMVLLMSVNPGFGGQAFIPRTVQRVRELADLCTAQGVSPLIQIDGGIDETTAPLVAEAGARVLVAGSAIFCADDPPNAMNSIREAAQAAI